ncbi:hypothetical protein GCM10010193_70830 [Kitasatospora atroaurantiaca]
MEPQITTIRGRLNSFFASASLSSGVSSCGYDTGSSWWCGPRGACGDENEGVQDRERERPGAALFKPLRQVIESINETFKGQLDLERHRGRTPGGVIARVMQRILALTAAIWHNDATGQTVLRSLIAYDH